MKEECVVSVAFRINYVRHSKVQEAWIKENNTEIDLILFRDKLPMSGCVHTDNIVSEFQKSLYGFKPHAIQHAIDLGYKKVIWLDPSILPTTSLDILVKSLDKHSMIVRTGDSPLSKMCNQKAKNWFAVSDEDIKDVKHIGGTIYAFNFNDPKVVEVFNLWKKVEEEGIFGNQDEFMAGHWADEACMALAMYKVGLPQYYESNFKYLNQKEL